MARPLHLPFGPDRSRGLARRSALRGIAATRRLPAMLLVAASAGTLSAATTAAGSVALLSPTPNVIAYRGANYFVGGTGPARGLYRSDGTRDGTRLVVPSKGRFAVMSRVGIVGNELTFTTGGTTTEPGGLFVSNDDVTGYRHALLEQRPVRRPPALEVRLSTDVPIVAGPQRYAIGAYEEGLTILFRIDWRHGTVTPLVDAGDGGIAPIAVTTDGDLFYHRTGRGDRLWRVGPRGHPVQLAADGGQGPYGVLGDDLYFTASDPVHGTEPWVTDGTPAGTHMVADLTPGAASSSIGALVTVKGSLYAFAGPAATPGNGMFAPSLLAGEGTPGPVTFGGAPVSGQRIVQAIAARDEAIYVQTGTGPAAARLRIPAGTLAAEPVPGPVLDEHGTFLAPSTPFFVSANSLRSTDASGTTTVLATTGVVDPSNGGRDPDVTELSLVGDDAWFKAPVVDRGPAVLWHSDGTVAGTGPVVTPGQIDPVESTVTARVATRRDRRAPYRWQLAGTVVALGIDPGTAKDLCTGTVKLTTTAGGSRRPLGVDRAPVRWTGTECAFRGTVAPPARAFTARRGTLGVSVRFAGTPHVRPSQHVQRVGLRYG